MSGGGGILNKFIYLAEHKDLPVLYISEKEEAGGDKTLTVSVTACVLLF